MVDDVERRRGRRAVGPIVRKMTEDEIEAGLAAGTPDVFVDLELKGRDSLPRLHRALSILSKEAGGPGIEHVNARER
jgi:hypothetical protein